MSNYSRLDEEIVSSISGAASPSSIVLPVSTDIRLVAFTIAPLLAGATFTSSQFLSRYFKEIVGTCYSDQSGTIYVQYSSDGVNYDGVSPLAYTGGQRLPVIFDNVSQYARIVYLNGAVNQAVFRLYIFGKL